MTCQYPGRCSRAGRFTLSGRYKYRENLAVNLQVALPTTYFLMTSDNVPFRQLFWLPLAFRDQLW
jgi:hypothetical protein